MSSKSVIKARIPATRNAAQKEKNIENATSSALPVAWMGIDRQNMPPVPANHTTDWLGALMDHSNLRFTGAYIQGDALIELLGDPPVMSVSSDFKVETVPAKSHNRRWMENIGNLRRQGWGIVFWYFGYSQATLPAPILAEKDASAYGRLHARHAKTSIHATSQVANTPLAGSVVFVDNEDGGGSPTKLIKAYYEAFFEELEKPGPGGAPAMRCGIYSQSAFARAFMIERPDLFVWQIEINLDNAVKDNLGQTLDAPFDQTYPLFIDPVTPLDVISSLGHVKSNREIQPFTIEASQIGRWTAWPLGRQFRFFIGQMPAQGWGDQNNVPLLKPVSVFDYDSSLVRDPSYPVAEPRIAATSNNILVASYFRRRTDSAAPQSAAFCIENPGQRTAVTTSTTPLVEPDAPVTTALFAGPNPDPMFITILADGNLGIIKREDGGISFPITSTITPVPNLRRLRAIGAMAFSLIELQVFFAGEDHQLYTVRGYGASWSAPYCLGELHPFSYLAATSRAEQSVDIFWLDDQGLLSVASWSQAQRAWQFVRIDQPPKSSAGPPLLNSTALAATSPSAEKSFVFGVRRTDLRLSYAEWNGPDAGWGEPKAFGSVPADSVSARLSPHTRLAAHSYGGYVEVVGLSHDGLLRLHTLEQIGTTWTTRPSVAYPNPEDNSTANGWSINPYGDLAIAREAEGTVVYAAGVAPGNTGVLRRNLSIEGSTWELLDHRGLDEQ
jgi:hypothetical protein